MPMREFRVALFAIVALACAVPAHAQSPYGIGRAAAPAEIAGWNIDVDRYGNNLPPGSGTVNHGRDGPYALLELAWRATGDQGVQALRREAPA